MKKIVSLLVALTLLVGCGGGGRISKEDATSKFMLLGDEYEMPISLEKMEEAGWKVDKYSQFDSLPSMGREYVGLEKDGNRISTVVVNPSKKDSYKDVMITELSVGYGFKSEEYEFFGGVKLDDNFDKVKKNLDALPVISLSNEYGYANYGTEGKELNFSIGDRGLVEEIEIVNYADWDQYDFKYTYDDYEDEIDDELDIFDDTDIDLSWMIKSEEQIKKDGDANREKYPLSDMNPFVNTNLGIYKVEGKIVKIPFFAEEDQLFFIEDKEGGIVAVADVTLKALNPDIKFEEGKEIVVYVSQIYVTEDTAATKIGLAPFAIITDYDGKTYSILDEFK